MEELRSAIREGDITVYKSPFTKSANGKPKNGKKRVAIGIPQGLPISSVLANIYLLDFDRAIIENLVKDESKKCYYRRYSDDLIIICNTPQVEEVKSFVLETIRKSDVEISEDKTEEFRFKHLPFNRKDIRLTSIKKNKTKMPSIGHPFTFLGFEFYGYQTLIKSANLAKFYRRMIYGVKRKSKRALKIAESNDSKPILFHNQLHRLYSAKDLRKTEIRRNNKKLILDKTGRGIYRYKVRPKSEAMRSNYFTYVNRAAQILGDKKIERQVRNHQTIYKQAVIRHFISKIKHC